MKKRSLTVSNWLLATIIGSLGFSSCEKPIDDPDIRQLYGIPYAAYSIKGKVINNLQNPVLGIKVEIQALKDQTAEQKINVKPSEVILEKDVK